MRSGTCMWQEVDERLIFRFQTDDTETHLYLDRREEFKLVGRGENFPLWIYRAEFSSAKKAREVLRILKSKEV